MIEIVTSGEIDEHTRRFSGLPWFEKIKENVVTVGGVGGLGSTILTALVSSDRIMSKG